MRQAGILAGAAAYALDHHVERLAEDHARAKMLAAGFAGFGSIDVDLNAVETNMVFLGVQDQSCLGRVHGGTGG